MFIIKPSLAWLGHLGLLYYISIYKLYSTFFLQIYDRAQLRMAVAAVEERKGVIAGLSDDDQHPGHQMILKLLLM